ncbi:MAG: toprim domain-containing protein [Elusimicrobiaceae bacterium]|nr:toprim domain-containing protein [Elusimicrobiaceae bacterium]
MTIGEAVQEIRRNWRQILPTLTALAKMRVNGEPSYICPKCGHGAHGDGLTFDPTSADGNLLHCFGCGFSGDIIDLYRDLTGADFLKALQELANMLGIIIDDQHEERQPAAQRPADPKPAEPEQDYTEYYRRCRERLKKDPAGLSYLAARGLSIETAYNFWVGFDPAWQSPKAIREGKNPPKTPRLILPVNATHYEARDTRPDHQAKPASGPDYRKMKEGSAATFNKKTLTQDAQEVFITEGIIDALSIIEAGGAAVGIASANRAQAFIDELTAEAAEGRKTAATLIICLDADEAGRRAAQTIKDGLQRLEISFLEADINGRYNDPNEHLQKDRAGFIAKIREAQRAARALTIDTGEQDIYDFFETVSTDRYKPIPTGIYELDNRLSGGFVSQWLIFINAAPGVGKTVLATQICENMARAGRKCLYFNFEMSKDQLIARSLARILQDNEIGALDILRFYKQDAKTQERIQRAGLTYKQEIAPNMLYNPDGTGPNLDRIIEVMERRAERAEAKGEAAPVVCIDYLQMIEGDPKEDVKETIKRAAYAFKKYAEEHKSIVICICAQSRSANNDSEARQDSGRDTSNIEYSADLQLQIMSDKNDENRRLLYVTKSRFTAASLKHAIEFNFAGKQGRFILIGDTMNRPAAGTWKKGK